MDYVKDVDIENASPKAKLLPVNQSFVSEYESVTRGTKRISDQDTCISSKYVRPQKQQRQQLSLDNHFSCKISPSNSSHAPSNQTNTASVYPGNANQRFATTVATSFNSIYDEWDSSSADYGDELVLFAVDRPRLQKISLYEILNWAIPLNKNGHQGFCKAYARLDLFLSQTIPTVKFTHREVKYVKDTLADGALESEDFNDRHLKFEYRHSTSDERPVMNDGCSLISVGAAKELCEDFGVKGVRPVAFQARINGCKTV